MYSIGRGTARRNVRFFCAKLALGGLVEKVCKSCGDSISDPATGRPRHYCSQACKRLAEFAIRRVTRRLEGLENRLSETRLGPYGNAWFLALENKTEVVITALEAEIALLNTRLRELLAE